MPKRGADGPEYGWFGEAGERGEAGDDGKEVGAGGTVALFCGRLSLESDATVSAVGGRGACGSNGGPGGDGGRGHDGYDYHELVHRHLNELGVKAGGAATVGREVRGATAAGAAPSPSTTIACCRAMTSTSSS
jgi:hypothetical protein